LDRGGILMLTSLLKIGDLELGVVKYPTFSFSSEEIDDIIASYNLPTIDFVFEYKIKEDVHNWVKEGF